MTTQFDAATVQRLIDSNVSLTHNAEYDGATIELGFGGGYAVFPVCGAPTIYPDFASAFAAWLAATGLDAGQQATEFQPAWKYAPPWAQWWAMDGDMACFWYSTEPNLRPAVWWTQDAADKWGKDHSHYGDALTSLDWRQSLRRRPNGPQP